MILTKIVRHNCNKKSKTILVRVEQFKIFKESNKSWHCTFKESLKNNSLNLYFKDLKEANVMYQTRL